MPTNLTAPPRALPTASCIRTTLTEVNHEEDDLYCPVAACGDVPFTRLPGAGAVLRLSGLLLRRLAQRAPTGCATQTGGTGARARGAGDLVGSLALRSRARDPNDLAAGRRGQAGRGQARADGRRAIPASRCPAPERQGNA